MPSPRTGLLKPVEEPTPKSTKKQKKAPSGRISAACEACKKRKTKCTGGPSPCQLCESLGSECVIDLTLDMRRRAALQRTIDEAKSHQQNLTDLLECIRDGDPTIMEALTDLLRSGRASAEVFATIQHYTQTIRDREAGDDDDDGTLPVPPKSVSNDLQPLNLPPHPVKLGDQHRSSPSGASIGSPLGQDKGKEVADSGHYAALLSHLRVLRDVHGEEVLRKLVDVNELARFFEKGMPGGDKYRVRQGPAHLPNEHSSELLELNDRRRLWHPALALSSPGPWSQMSTDDLDMTEGQSRPETVNPMLHDAPNKATRDDESVAQRSEQASYLLPTDDHLPLEPADENVFGLSFMPEAGLRTVPYAEAIHETFRNDVQDLCIAHEDPTFRLRVPIHLVQPLIVPDQAPMSRVFTDYLQGAREMILHGASIVDSLGPSDDIVVDLLYRQRAPGDAYDCSSWACEVYRSFTDVDQHVQLANVFFSARLMKWLLMPTIENYAKLPSMMRPTPMQRQIPHIGAIDLVPIPCIRDAAISELRDWLSPLSEARWTVNWPVWEHAAVARDLETNSMKLTPHFMDHVAKYENWTIGSSFLRAFPDVAGQINLHV